MSIKERKELLKKAYRKIKNTKGKKLFKDKKAYYYKTFCVEKLDNVIEMFDTTTDVYRPLKNYEIKCFLILVWRILQTNFLLKIPINHLKIIEIYFT